MQGNTPEVRSTTSMVRHVGLACVLALGGCESAGSSGLQVVAPEGCSASDPAVVYRLTELRVPTVEDVTAGAVLGHDLDGVEDACGIADYDGGVDNAFLDIAEAFPSLTSRPFTMQDVVDEALFCSPTDAACLPTWVGVRVQECREGVKVDVVQVTDDACVVLGSAETAGLARDGRFEANLPSLSLAFEDADGPRVPFSLVNVRLTAVVTEDGLAGAVLGGSILVADMFALVVSFFEGQDIAFHSPQAVFVPLADTSSVPGGACDGLSVGLTLSAAVEPSEESCE